MGNAGEDEEFWDDLSGEKLRPELVRHARSEEMAEVRKHGLYTGTCGGGGSGHR